MADVNAPRRSPMNAICTCGHARIQHHHKDGCNAGWRAADVGRRCWCRTFTEVTDG